MIGSFRDKRLETLYFEGAGTGTRGIPADLHKVIRRKLDQLYNATGIKDLSAPPGNRLEALKGERLGWHSIRINDQWRLIFRWREDSAYEIALVDYH